MSARNGEEYKNPAYRYNYIPGARQNRLVEAELKSSPSEETGHQNHDTRSSSSTSSVKRFLHMKLKAGGKARWIVLIVVIFILILIIAAICATVVVLKTENEETRLQEVKADSNKNDGAASTVTPSKKMTTSGRSGGPTTWKPQSTRKVTTQQSPSTTTPFVDLSSPKNTSVQISDIDFYPGAKRLTISCQAFHKGNLQSVDIRRQFKDSYEPIATVLVVSESETSVLVFANNVTYKKVARKYEMLLSVTFDPFDCGDLTNFSCAAVTEDDTKSALAKITINNEPPLIEIPHSIIENKNISLECEVTLWGNESALVWVFKPESSDIFMTFNVEPLTNMTYNDCITTISSKLTFAPTMYEHGAVFRCQIEPRVEDSRVLRDSDHADVYLQVVPKSFCDDKRQFTINKHPYEPCSLVVYCLNTGPLVYEIECEPGQCYDANSTKCVEDSVVRSGIAPSTETVRAPSVG